MIETMITIRYPTKAFGNAEKLIKMVADKDLPFKLWHLVVALLTVATVLVAGIVHATIQLTTLSTKQEILNDSQRVLIQKYDRVLDQIRGDHKDDMIVINKRIDLTEKYLTIHTSKRAHQVAEEIIGDLEDEQKAIRRRMDLYHLNGGD